MREERKVVTALFADLVGSTPLGEALDPEEARLVVGDAVGRMVRAVEEFGGTVEHLAGDGLLALFGAPVAHEDDPERAIRAGLRIVQDVAEYGMDVARAWGVPGLAVRVGVNSGPVVLGRVSAGERPYAAYGDTVNTAARLQTAAQPGTVLVGEPAQRAVEPLFEWGERQQLTLKGKGRPVPAYTAHAARVAPAKPRGFPREQARLVGREHELALGQQALDDVLAGRGGLLFITGEAGIGKSRLMAELRDTFREAAGTSARSLWLEGRCVSYGETLPYWPFRDLLREWLGAGAEEPELRVRIALRRNLERLLGGEAVEMYPYLGAMLGLALEPEVTSHIVELSPEALQYRTFEVVRQLFERLAAEGPLVVALEDLHWADPTSVQLTERLLPMTEGAAVLVVVAARQERDHPSWAVKETAARQFPHRLREIVLEALSGEADRELLDALVGPGTLPEAVEAAVLERAEGNPFFLEELVRELADTGALARTDGGWRFDHEVAVEVPPTVEKVILARVDRLDPACHEVLTAASVLGRQFTLPLLEGIAAGDRALADHGLADSLLELQRLDLIRESRRWPVPEFRFKHALIQEATYGTILTKERHRLHRRAAEWLQERYAGNEDEVLGLLAHHWLAAADEDSAVTFLTRAGDKARLEYALDEAIGHYTSLLPMLERRGAQQEIALVLFKLALALHQSLRFAEANETYQRAFRHWTPPAPWQGTPAAELRIATSFLPNDPDPKSAIAWPNIQLCMQLFDRLVEQWPERTIVPALAERWEIADDGLRYVFHLREGLRWSDGHPLTAHDVEFGIKRVLDPESPGSSVAIYFVLENGQDYYLRRNRDREAIGVRALDERTLEFRLVAPAPYFMSVMNRPDGGPQPRHAIERDGESWTLALRQVVSGPFQQVERALDHLVLERQGAYSGARAGNVGRITFVRSSIVNALGPFGRGELDVVAVRYTPRLADLMPGAVPPEARLGPASWSAYIRFDHVHPAASNLDLRRALAHAIDREALSRIAPANLVVATGGVVPPALQGHTPNIALRFDPDLAREYMRRSGFSGDLELAGMEVWDPILEAIAEGWRGVFGRVVEVRSWTWRTEEATQVGGRAYSAPIRITGWLPGYPDPEYFLRLLFHSDSRTNEGGFAYPPFDALIERARQERDDRLRLELYHQADRMAVADRVACIPLVYGRSVAYVKPWVRGWWEFGKSSTAFGDLVVEPDSPRASG